MTFTVGGVDVTAVHVGPTPAVAVYLGAEKVWPSGPGLRSMILAYNPIHYWPCDEPAGSLTDLGSDPVTLSATGSPNYGSPVGAFNGVELAAANYFQGTWDEPSQPFTIIYFSEPNGGNSQFVGDVTGHVYDLLLRSHGPAAGRVGEAPGWWWGKSGPSGVLHPAYPGNSGDILMAASVDASNENTVSYRHSTDPPATATETHSHTAATSVQLRLNAAFGAASMAHVAVIPSVLTPTDIDGLWAAFQNGV